LQVRIIVASGGERRLDVKRARGADLVRLPILTLIFAVPKKTKGERVKGDLIFRSPLCPFAPSLFNPQSSFLAQGCVAQRAQFIVGVLPLTIEVRGNDPG
jgi:hypothetical protein